MRRVVFIGLLLLMMVVPVQAVDGEYRLRAPSVEEYLHAILELPALSRDDYGLLEAELITRYTDEIGQQDYDLVDAAYRFFEGTYLQNEMHTFWLQARVAAWLKSQQIDLNVATVFEFEDVEIPVIALDLNNDGQNEWILDLQQNDFQGYVVIRRDENESYRVVSTPLPFERYQQLMFAPEGIAKAQWNIEYFEDVTGDGQPELVVLYTFQNDEYEYAALEGQYFILSWSDNSLVDVGGEALSFRLRNLGTTWEWMQADASAALSLRQIREMRDNWDCIWQQTTLFDWDGKVFTETQTEEHYPETIRCYLRLAENAMRAKDYDGAIMNYRHVERLDSPDNMSWVGDYAAIRLAIALILNGEEDRGIEILRSQQNERALFGTLPELTSALLDAYDNNPSSVGVCLAASDFFWINSYYVWEKMSLEVGRTMDNIIYGRGMYIPPPTDPIGAGCDAPALIEDILHEHMFTTRSTPVEQLQSLGIPWDSVFYDDLNEDGIDDWIVGVSAINIPPVFFLSDGTVYSVSRPALSPPHELDALDQLLTFQLPDNAGIALLHISYAQPYIQIPRGYGLGGGPGECPALGSVSIWRLDQSALIRIFSSLLCEEVDPQAVIDDLAVISHVYSWEFSDGVHDYVPVEYVWNEIDQAYELTTASQETLAPLSSETSVSPPYQVYDGKNLFLQQAYEQIINDRQQAITEILDITDPVLLRWGYLAALTFEALDRPDEALAEYIAIHEAAPESAWGILAALHLEVIDGE